MELFHLSKPQKSVWNMEKYFGSSVANITASVFFQKPIDIAVLETAFNKTIEQCDALRIRIKLENGIPMQYISAPEHRKFDVLRFADHIEFESWIRVVTQTHFSTAECLYKIFLFKINKKVGFILHCHHIITDAWGLNIIFHTLLQNLTQQSFQTEKRSYLEYLKTEEIYMKSSQARKDRQFFLDMFQKCKEPLYLNDKQTLSTNANRRRLKINQKETQLIQDFCKQNHITAFALFMHAAATYLYRIKGAENIYIGTTVRNRNSVSEIETAGIFVNTVPMLLQIDEQKSTMENLEKTAYTILEIFRHQKYPYLDFLADIRSQYGFTGRLYDVMLNYRSTDFIAKNEDKMDMNWHFCRCQGESIVIHVNENRNDGVFLLDYDYKTELFDEMDILQIHMHLRNLMINMIRDAHQKPQELKLLSERESRQLKYVFNNTAGHHYPKDICVHTLFEEQVQKTPAKTAIIFEGKEYTYQQIDAMSNSLASVLKEKGVGRNDIVGIIARRNYKVVVAQLAVLKAGGAYLPIDPDDPQKRIALMLSDARCKAALILNALITEMEGFIQIDLSDESVFQKNNQKIENINQSEDQCYAIFTSGSAGTPKGTVLTHHNVLNFCLSKDADDFLQNNVDRVLAVSAIGFDIFVTESLMPLLRGLTIIFANDDEAKNQFFLSKLVMKHNAELIAVTPSKIMTLLYDEKNNEYFKCFKTIILGGEPLDSTLIEKIRNCSSAKIFNVYGSSETTVWSTNGEVVSKDITIGKPIANTQVYILDKHRNLLPIGSIGELCIAGDGVGKGYLNRTELTVEKFIKNPFGNGRMYRTGDLAKWRKDGKIEFIGRMDYQVMIRGMRIELGEIENAIARIINVKQLAVVDKIDERGRQYICAYYVNECEIDARKLKTELQRDLPKYMIPHFIIRVEKLPVTSSGKTDKNALPAPVFDELSIDTEYIKPRTILEKRIVALVQTVLDISRVGMNHDFFNLGGDSLKAIELVVKAQSEGIYFDLQDVFDYPTPTFLIQRILEKNYRRIRYHPNEFQEFHHLLSKNAKDDTFVPLKQNLGNAFITGATGYLGAHVLDAYLTNSSQIAYCLVRGDSLAHSQERLREALNYFFPDKYTDCGRIVTICGDITNWIDLSEEIDFIFHCAAHVKHYGTYQIANDVNVLGTKRIIEFARLKNAKLIHISTTSISGSDVSVGTEKAVQKFSERDLMIGQSMENIYVHSKFDAEVEVLKAKLTGIQACIVRVGNLSNRYVDVKFQKNHQENAVLMRLRALVDLGLIPESFMDFQLEFSPVDETAEAVICLAQHFTDRFSVYHVYYPEPVYFKKFLKALENRSLAMRIVSEEDFTEAISKTAERIEKKYIYQAFIHKMDAEGNIILNDGVAVENSFTKWFLSQCGFKWQPIDESYLNRYVDYFIEIGFWGVDES